MMLQDMAAPFDLSGRNVLITGGTGRLAGQLKVSDFSCRR